MLFSAPPDSKRSICRATYFEISSGSVSAALCGVNTTFGWIQNGLFGGSGLGFVDIERGGTQRAVIEARQDIGFILQSAAAGIDQHRRTQRAAAIQFRKQIAIEDVPGVRRKRQQADEDIGLPQERVEVPCAMEAFDAVDLPWAAAPARDAKAQPSQDLGGVRPERAKPHDADRDRAGRPLEFWRPPFFAL